jgi:hypothetical protein
MAGAARVGKWRSKSKAGGKYLLNKNGQDDENGRFGVVCGELR